jgi:4-hydroxythreonine-4-phosphate dehydrogenase
VNQVSQALTREKICRAILDTVQGLQDFWGIQKPRIAVAALNPHAGESGLFGREEIEVIEPEIREIQHQAQNQFKIEGPIPADTLFAKHLLAPQESRYDAVVCMYHDQGLIPVKLLDFPNTVNVTLGLPMIRTSVDHGVGFDIAGQGIADPSSLRAALRLAKIFVEKKHWAERAQV